MWIGTQRGTWPLFRVASDMSSILTFDCGHVAFLAIPARICVPGLLVKLLIDGYDDPSFSARSMSLVIGHSTSACSRRVVHSASILVLVRH